MTLERTTHRDGAIQSVRLVPAGAEHAPLWQEWRGQAAARRYMPLAPASVEQLAARLSACAGTLSDRSKSEYRWMVEADGEVVGTVAATNTSWGSGYAEIAFMLSEAVHGRGVGTRAVALLLRTLFEETELYRVFATISADNVASQRLVERLGFRLEGVLRQHYVIGGRRVDQMIFGLLRPEVPPRVLATAEG